MACVKIKGISQEQLAEKIYVSRQAITKWESGNGIPDIENLIAISSLFNESLDSLLSEEKSLISKHEFLYESRTEYDLDSPKKIDLRVGLAHEVIIEKTKDEKIQVLAASNKLCYIAQQVKVKIVEDKKRMDVIVNHSADLSDIAAMENLFIRVRIPEKFVADIALSSELENLKVRDIVFDAIEFDGKVKNAFITNANGHLELNTNSNVNVEVNGLKGKLDINHFHAVSKIHFMEQIQNTQAKYIYRPKRFYALVFLFTWGFWLFAILFNEGLICSIGMVLGVISPAVIAIITVFTSKSDALKKDFRRKIFNFWKLKPQYILGGFLIMLAVICCSILTSVLFGGSLEQFSFIEGFTFDGPGLFSAYATICLAAILEEVGWRGYGEDSIAEYHSWFKESIIFGFIWALWHLPLFWIPGTYHITIRQMSPWFMVNFMVSTIPMGFVTTWVYVKNGRSMLASILFHLFVNTMQEKIAMTQPTKCIESFFVLIAAVIIVLTNKDMFFEKRHVGHLLE